MPTYEYACKQCGEHLEVVQSFKDEPLKECPNCGGDLRKVFSPIGIAFKGSGFYKTDSRSASKGASKPAEAKGSESTSSDSKSSDSKSSESKSSESKSSESKKDTKAEAKPAAS
jgi:putative FmdB family regulatory protein